VPFTVARGVLTRPRTECRSPFRIVPSARTLSEDPPFHTYINVVTLVIRTAIRWDIKVFTPKAAAIFLAAGLGLFFYFRYEKAKLLEQRENEQASKQFGRPQIGGPFTLSTQDGDTFTEKNLRGKWSLVYFGFTNCPDICPQELDKMTTVLDVIENEHGAIFQPVFISVDPARDTPSRIGKYLKDFHSSFIGLVGPYEEIKATCKAYRVYFSTPPNANPAGDYLVDHSIFVYLIDPEGVFVEAFGQSVSTEEIAKKVREALGERNNRKV